MQFLLLSLALSAALAAPLPQQTQTELDSTLAALENDLGTSLPAIPRRRSALDIAGAVNPSALANGLDDTDLVHIDARSPSELDHLIHEIQSQHIGTTQTDGLPPIRVRQTAVDEAAANVEFGVNDAELTLDQQTGDLPGAAPVDGATADVTSGVENGVNAALQGEDGQAVDSVVGGVEYAGHNFN